MIWPTDCKALISSSVLSKSFSKSLRPNLTVWVEKGEGGWLSVQLAISSLQYRWRRSEKFYSDSVTHEFLNHLIDFGDSSRLSCNWLELVAFSRLLDLLLHLPASSHLDSLRMKLPLLTYRAYSLIWNLVKVELKKNQIESKWLGLGGEGGSTGRGHESQSESSNRHHHPSWILILTIFKRSWIRLSPSLQTQTLSRSHPIPSISAWKVGSQLPDCGSFSSTTC